MGGRLVEHLNRFAVEEQVFPRVEKRVRGERRRRQRRIGITIRLSAFSWAMMRAVSGCRGADVANDVAAGAGPPGLGDRFIAAGVIAVHMRVDDPADRLIRQLPDRVESLPAERSELRVDDHDPFGSREHGRIAAGADDHVDIAADLLNVQLHASKFCVCCAPARVAAAPAAPAMTAAATAARRMVGKNVPHHFPLPGAADSSGHSRTRSELRIHRLGAAAAATRADGASFRTRP